MIPYVVDVWHYSFSQLGTFLGIFGLEELKDVLVSEGAVELYGVAHSCADHEDANPHENCAKQEDNRLIEDSVDESMREELNSQHTDEINIQPQYDFL